MDHVARFFLSLNHNLEEPLSRSYQTPSVPLLGPAWQYHAGNETGIVAHPLTSGSGPLRSVFRVAHSDRHTVSAQGLLASRNSRNNQNRKKQNSCEMLRLAL